MRDTLLANIGCLAVFQVAGSDVRQLVWELDRDRVSEEDIVSLPVHHAYVRATVGTERTPAFSMEVLKPEERDPGTAAQIRRGASAYLLTEEEIAAQRAEGHRRVEQWLEEREEASNAAAGARHEGGDPSPDKAAASGQDLRGKQSRSKRNQPPGGASPEDAA